MVIGVLARFLFSKSVAVLMITAAIALPVLLAQETINNASVSGRVTDPTGAVVEGATVTARQTETNLPTPRSRIGKDVSVFPTSRSGRTRSASGIGVLRRRRAG